MTLRASKNLSDVAYAHTTSCSCAATITHLLTLSLHKSVQSDTYFQWQKRSIFYAEATTTSSSVTRWLLQYSLFVHLQPWKIAQWYTKFAKVGNNFCQILNKPSLNCQRHFNFCQSGEISPNVVTLTTSPPAEQILASKINCQLPLFVLRERYSRKVWCRRQLLGSLFALHTTIVHAMLSYSVTRLGKISPHWQKFTSFGRIFDGLFLIWQNAEATLAKKFTIGVIFIVANGQKLKNNLTIWSHWMSTGKREQSFCDAYRLPIL